MTNTISKFRQRDHLSPFLFVASSIVTFILEEGYFIGLAVSTMGTKMKGIYKGFKYISQIFVVKEREIEIGYPTDVKHVAHIGWDSPSSTAPSWMNEFKTGPDFAATSIGNSGSALSPWSSQDFGESMGRQPTSEMFKDIQPSDLPNIPKKQKRKKSKSTSSPKSSSSSRSSRAAKSSKAKFVEGNTKPSNIEVA
ncbi:hypothetical protein RJ639_023387 [Escallonia herrerae]|uniref:CRIB domain-containing protein n=1 Tax=Escallonia herrerae TaxID=1293975 RepID=A0AA88V0N3_9ASTE|nr:hypothetical protein RJ639_023387 [Escallonia herrerae]